MSVDARRLRVPGSHRCRRACRGLQEGLSSVGVEVLSPKCFGRDARDCATAAMGSARTAISGFGDLLICSRKRFQVEMERLQRTAARRVSGPPVETGWTRPGNESR